MINNAYGFRSNLLFAVAQDSAISFLLVILKWKSLMYY